MTVRHCSLEINFYYRFQLNHLLLPQRDIFDFFFWRSTILYFVENQVNENAVLLFIVN